MILSRRRLLMATAALVLTPRGVRAGAFPTLEARVARQQLAPDGYAVTETWGFDGSVPGPELRVPQGGRVQRRVINNLPQPTSVHWHGIRIDNAMDGVPGLTQAAIPQGESFDYDFVVPDAGTYWYHSHNRSMEQVARGLYGVLVVEEPQPPEVDRDLPLAIDDWRLDPETVQIIDDFDNARDLSHAGRIGNIATVNGQFDPKIRVMQNERLRLRLVNAANARIFEIGLTGLEGWVVALDGMPLAEPLAVTGSFTLAPAQRADLIVDVTAQPGEVADLLSIERDGGFGLVQFEVRAKASAARRDPVTALAPNAMPDLAGFAEAPLHSIVMAGGAMRWLETARLGTTEMNGRELAQLGKFWALNGQVDRGDAPFLTAARNEIHRIAFINDTGFPHGMHLHGHHFRAIADDGSLGPWRDTILVAPGETRQIVVKTDNPGDWLLHCHMLGHAAAGMMSWVRVTT